MTEIKFRDGVNDIDKNKFLANDKDGKIFVDFGINYHIVKMYSSTAARLGRYKKLPKIDIEKILLTKMLEVENDGP